MVLFQITTAAGMRRPPCWLIRPSARARFGLRREAEPPAAFGRMRCWGISSLCPRAKAVSPLRSSLRGASARQAATAVQIRPPRHLGGYPCRSGLLKHGDVTKKEIERYLQELAAKLGRVPLKTDVLARIFHDPNAGLGNPAYKDGPIRIVGRVPSRGAGTPFYAAYELSGLEGRSGVAAGD